MHFHRVWTASPRLSASRCSGRHARRAFLLDDGRWRCGGQGIDLDQEAGVTASTIEARLPSGTLRVRRGRFVVKPKIIFPTRTLQVSPDFVNPPGRSACCIRRDTAHSCARSSRPLRRNASGRGGVRSPPIARSGERPSSKRFEASSTESGGTRMERADFKRGTPLAGPSKRQPEAAAGRSPRTVLHRERRHHRSRARGCSRCPRTSPRGST